MSDSELKKTGKLELKDAYDFDARDPLFGLSRDEMSGPCMTRRATLRLLAAAGGLCMAQVLPGLGPKVAHAAGESGGTLKCAWAGVGEIVTLDPARINQVLQFQIASNVLSGLMHINPNLIAEGDLAESWTVSDDGLSYLFKLREGVTFHNGDAFTSKDVLYTYNRSKDPEKSIHSRVIANVTNLEALNDFEVKFTLAKPQASFLTKALERSSGRAMTIVSGNAIESMGLAQYGLTPVGTGPFKIAEHNQGSNVVLEKFENYYDPERPKLDKIIITPVDGTEPLAAAIESGDVQFIGGNPLPPQLVSRFNDNPDLTVTIKPGPGFQSVWLNPWRDFMKVTDFNKPVDELKKEKGFMVRLALAKALDRELYIKQALFGNGVAAHGTINPAMGFYFDEALAESSEQAFDPEGAKQLLSDAGYPGGDGFPELELITTPNTKRAGQVVANIYKQVLGITVKVAPMEFSVGIEKFNKNDFDMRLGGSGGDFDPDDGLVDWMQTSSKFNGPARDKEAQSHGFFSSDEVDSLVDQQAGTADPDARKALVQQANKITSDKVACGFLFHPVDIRVHAASVNVPAESQIPGLTDFDRITMS